MAEDKLDIDVSASGTDDFDFGDIDNIDFDDLDFEKMANEPVTPGTVGRKTLSALVTVDKNRVEKFLKKAVPTSVGSGYDKATSTVDSISRAISRNTGKAKAEIESIAKSISDILPEQGMLRDLFSKVYNPKEERERYEASEEERERDYAKSEVLEAFGDISKVQEMQTAIDQFYSNKRTQSTNEILKGIASGIGFLKEYNFSFTSKFQNKMLEIGVQQLNTVNDIRRTIREAFEINQQNLKEIVHNTALPDILKARNNFDTIFKEVGGRGRQQLVDRLFENNLSKALRERIDSKIDSYFDTALELLGMGAMGAEALADQHKLNKEMGRNLGDTIADNAIDYVDGIGAKGLGKLLNKNETLREWYYKFVTFMDNPYVMLNKYADQIEDKTFLHTLFAKGLREVGDMMNVTPNSKTAVFNRYDPNDVAQFDFRTRNSINKVMPTYLRKIHAEILAIRLGWMEKPNGYKPSDPLEMHYEENTDEFNTMESIQSKINKFITEHGTKFRRDAKSILGSFSKKHKLHEKFNKVDRFKLNNWLTSMIVEGNMTATDLTEKLTADDIAGTAGVSIETAEAFIKEMKSIYLQDPDNIANLTKAFTRIKAMTPGFANLLESSYNSSHYEHLIDSGILSKDSEGNVSSNDDMINLLAFRNFGLELDDESRKKLQAMKNKLLDSKENKFKGSFLDNIDNLYKYTKEEGKNAYEAVANSEFGKNFKATYDRVSKFVDLDKLKEKYDTETGKVIDKVMGNPYIQSAVLVGKAAYNTAIDKVVEQIGHELDAAEKSKLVRDLQRQYGRLKTGYDQVLGSKAVKQIGLEAYKLRKEAMNKAIEENPELREFLLKETDLENPDGNKTTPQAEGKAKERQGVSYYLSRKIGGMFGTVSNWLGGFKKEVEETDEIKEIKASVKGMLEHQFVQDGLAIAEEYKGRSQAYIDTIKERTREAYEKNGGKGVATVIGDMLKADSEDARKQLEAHKNKSDMVNAIHEASKSGDKEFILKTIKMAKDLGLSKFEEVKNAAGKALSLLKAKEAGEKSAVKGILNISSPVDAVFAIMRLGAAGANLIPFGTTVKLLFRAANMYRRIGWSIDKWLWGGTMKSLWNGTGGNLLNWTLGKAFNMDFKFAHKRNIMQYLNPINMVLGGGAGLLGGLWRNKKQIGGGLWDVGKGLVHATKLPFEGLLYGADGMTKSGNLQGATKLIGSGLGKLLGSAGDTAFNTLEQYGLRAKTGSTANAWSHPEQKSLWESIKSLPSNLKERFRKKDEFEEAEEMLGVEQRRENMNKEMSGPWTVMGAMNDLYSKGLDGWDQLSGKAKEAIINNKYGRAVLSKEMIDKLDREAQASNARATLKDKSVLLKEYKYALQTGDKEVAEQVAKELMATVDGNKLKEKAMVSTLARHNTDIDVEKSMEVIDAKHEREKELEKLNKEKKDSMILLGTVVNFLTAKPEIQREALQYVDKYAELRPAAKLSFMTRIKNWFKNKIFNKLKAGWNMMKKIGGAGLGFLGNSLGTLLGPLLSPLLGAVGGSLPMKILGGIGKGILAGISPTLYNKMAKAGGLFSTGYGRGASRSGGLITRSIGAVKDGLGSVVNGTKHMLGMGGGAMKLAKVPAAMALAATLGAGGLNAMDVDVVKSMTPDTPSTQTTKQVKKPSTPTTKKQLYKQIKNGNIQLVGKNVQTKVNADSINKAKQVVQGVDANSAINASGGDGKKKGLMAKLKSKLSGFKEKAKSMIFKKIGPKAGASFFGKLAGKLAARLAPFTGWALLALDVGTFGYYLATGLTILSAISMTYLGFDLFSDGEEGVIKDEDGNVIAPDEEDKKELENEKVPDDVKKQEATASNDPVKEIEKNRNNETNPLVVRTSTGGEGSKKDPFDMSIFKSNLDISEKQLVVMMSSNEQLKQINQSLKSLNERLGIMGEKEKTTTPTSVKPNERKMVYETSTPVLNNSRSYNI